MSVKRESTVVLNFFPRQTQWSVPTTWRWRQRNSCKRHSRRMGLWWRKLWRHHRRSQGIHLQVVGQKFQVSTDLRTLYLAETAATLCDCTNCIALLTVLKQNQKLSLPPLSKVNLSAHANLNHFLDFCRFCGVTVQVTHSLGSSKNQTDGIVTRQLSVLF